MTERFGLLTNRKTAEYVASCAWPEGQDYLSIGKLQHMLPDLHERWARITYQLENCSIWHQLCMHEGQDYLPIGKLQHMISRRPGLPTNRKTPAYVASCAWPKGQDYLPIGKLQQMLPAVHDQKAKITLKKGKLQHMLPAVHARRPGLLTNRKTPA